MNKKSNRLLALSLSLVLGLSGMTFDYQNVKATDTSAEDVSSEWDYDISFEGKSTKDITDFTSSKFDSSDSYRVTEQDKTVYDHWFTGTGSTDEYGRNTGYTDQGVSWATGNRCAGLKPLTGYGKAYRYLLSYNGSLYTNYEVKAEIHSNLASDGIAFGEKNVFASSASASSARVYFTGTNTAGRLKLEGAFDYTSYKVTGNSADTTNLGFNTNTNVFTFYAQGLSRGQVFELHVKKTGNTVSIWADGYEPVLTIELASTWKEGPVSLCSNGTAPGGGFKSFAIKEIKDVPEPGFFVNADLSTMTDFTSTKVDVNDQYSIVGEADQPVSEHWFTGRDTTLYPQYETNRAYRNAGLKPKLKSTDGYMSYFTYNGKTSNNFETSVSFYKNFIGYGLIIGQKNTYPQALDSPGVRLNIHTQGGAYYLAVTGAIDTPTAVSSGTKTGAVVQERDRVLLKLDGYTITHDASDLANSDLANKVITTIHAKVNNGRLTASVDGLGVEVTVDLNGAYVDDVVSLFSTGANQGGFDDFKIEDLTASTPKDRAQLTYTMKPMNDFAAVVLSTDAGYSKVNGTLNYDPAVYEYAGASFEEDNFCINAKHQPEHNAETGTIDIASFANAEGKVVSVYFKTKSHKAASDFSGFHLGGEGTVVVSGGTTATTTQSLELENDYNGDKLVNIVDLVVVKKSETDETVETTQLLRKILVGLNDNVSPLLGKTVLCLGDSIVKGDRDAFGMAWSGRIAINGVICENVAQNGWALTNTTVSGRGGAIVSQLDSAQKDSYDFVLLEGAVNDVLVMQGGNTQIQWGEPVNQIDSTYDTATIAGAMQDLIVKTKAKFPNARIVYIINSYYGANDANMALHRQTVKKVCDIHSIDYVDLSDTEAYPQLAVLTKSNDQLYKQYLPDGLHPNAASYDLTTPYIIDVMER